MGAMGEAKGPILYEVAPGSRIKVDTKSHPGQFALATVKTTIEAIKASPDLLPPDYPKQHERAMELFLAMNSFTLSGFSYHPDTVGHYDPNTFFFAYNKKGAGVTKKRKEEQPQQASFW